MKSSSVMTVKRNRIRLGDLFPELDLVGDFSHFESLEAGRIVSAEKQALEGDLVFIAQDRALKALEVSQPTAFVISDSLWDEAAKKSTSIPLLRSRDAMLAFAKASRHFSSESTPKPGQHPSAIIHSSAKISSDVYIGPGVEIGEEASIGEGAILHSNVQIGPRSIVGPGSVLFPGVVIYQDVILGEEVRIHANSVIGIDGFGYVQEKTPKGVRHVKIHHLGGVRIGSRVEIGSNTTIDRGTLGDTLVGDGCIIDNQVHIGHNCVLEEGVVLCGCVGLAGGVHIEKFAVLAGFVGVANKVRVGAGAQVAAYTALTSHVPAGEKWGGIPSMPRGEYARLQVLFKRLPELFERKKREGKA